MVEGGMIYSFLTMGPVILKHTTIKQTDETKHRSFYLSVTFSPL